MFVARHVVPRRTWRNDRRHHRRQLRETSLFRAIQGERETWKLSVLRSVRCQPLLDLLVGRKAKEPNGQLIVGDDLGVDLAKPRIWFPVSGNHAGMSPIDLE